MVKDGIRINSFLSQCGLGSRRLCDQYIQQGRISCNGNVILDYSFTVTDKNAANIYFDNKRLQLKQKLYFAMNKPSGYLCTRKSQSHKKTIYDLIKDINAYVFHVGRLDYLSSGLLLLTNDGTWANTIMHPKYNIVKVYFVKTKEDIPDKLIDTFLKGLQYKNIYYKANDIQRIDNKKVKITLNEGKKREIRNVFLSFGLKIEDLYRTQIGHIKIGSLASGKHRNLKLSEINGFFRSS